MEFSKMEDRLSQLAYILRENGDKVLNSLSKFSLSVDLLKNLNNSFGLIIEQRDLHNSSFHVVNNSNVGVKIFRDIQFLYDFVQRTVSLKLITDSFDTVKEDIVDITKFKNLKLLELYKTGVMCMVGIQSLRPQLQYLICVRSITTLEEILEKCGGDNSQGFIWSELKEACFSHNNLQSLDSSLEFVPWLHTLDLSHNCIRDASPLSCLSNLKHLNLSYNWLESVPLFTSQMCSRLQVLILSNNFLEDIRELVNLSNLCELDLSDNCLLEHGSLLPLVYLATLQWLNLEGNPLSFHPQHRIRTIRYLHANTGTVRFLLDGIYLRKHEQKTVGSIKPTNSLLQRTHLSSFCSTTSEQNATTVERSRRVRNATISDTNQPTDMEVSAASVASLITSNEYLETKKQIEQLREQYGETWLHSQGGSLVQDALGLEKTPLPLTSTPYEKEFLLYADIHQLKSSGDASEQSTNTFISATESIENENSLYPTEQTVVAEILTDEDDEDLIDKEENLYLATVKDETEPVFIVITASHICERECTSTNKRAKWLLDSLLSCELITTDKPYVHLQFDTVRRDRKERTYELEEEDRTRLINVLDNMLSSRPTKKLKIIAYRCIKCMTQFGKEKQGRETEEETLTCPTCNSTLVIEDDEEE